jgi:hypothetical protein
VTGYCPVLSVIVGYSLRWNDELWDVGDGLDMRGEYCRSVGVFHDARDCIVDEEEVSFWASSATLSLRSA